MAVLVAPTRRQIATRAHARRARRRRFGRLTLGAAVVAAIAAAVLAGPLFVPYAPEAQAIAERLGAPSAAHVLGTDAFGRDVLARLADDRAAVDDRDRRCGRHRRGDLRLLRRRGRRAAHAPDRAGDGLSDLLPDHPRRRDVRLERAASRPRHRSHRLAGRGSRHPRRGAEGPLARLRPRGARHRRVVLAHPRPPHHPERSRRDRHLGDDPGGDEHPHRGGPQLPRARRAAPARVVGEHDRREREDHAHGVVAHRDPRRGDLPRGLRLQPLWRGRARCRRSSPRASTRRHGGMSRYWTGRLLQAIPLLFAVSLAVFAVLHLAPGDPATLLADPAYLTESQRAAIHRSLGLDDALPIQYVRTMAGIVTGRLQSFRTTEPTLAMLGSALPTTAAVGLIGLALATVAGVVLGAAAATRPGGYLDRLLGVAIVSAV